MVETLSPARFSFDSCSSLHGGDNISIEHVNIMNSHVDWFESSTLSTCNVMPHAQHGRNVVQHHVHELTRLAFLRGGIGVEGTEQPHRLARDNAPELDEVDIFCSGPSPRSKLLEKLQQREVVLGQLNEVEPLRAIDGSIPCSAKAHCALRFEVLCTLPKNATRGHPQ